MMFRRFAGVVAALSLFGAPAFSASIPQLSGSQYSEPSQILGTVNTVINSINAAVTPQTMATFSGNRNFIDNGSMDINQRGTGIQTCGTTTAPATSISADRWQCNANVTSGAGRQVYSTSSPPVGFTGFQTIYRTSGALTQPVCSIQEIPTIDATKLAAQPVVLSFQAQALAGLAADNGSVINAYIFTGTGSDQGLQSFTASPAITPAFTGIATLQSTAFTISTSWTTYSAPAVYVPSNVTEIAVALCFTPTATGAGVTDGFGFTAVQLEQGTTASTFERLPIQVETARAQRYHYRIAESATIWPVATCAAVDTTHTNCLVPFPVPMRAAPTLTFTAGFASPTSTSQATLGACSALAAATTVTSTVGATTGALVNCTATTIPAAGVASFLYSNNGSGVIEASADF